MEKLKDGIAVADVGCGHGHSTIKLKINSEKCDQYGICLICPGIVKEPEGLPQFTNLCSGCADQEPACLQMCPFGAIEPLARKETVPAAVPRFEAPPEAGLPARLSLAIRLKFFFKGYRRSNRLPLVQTMMLRPNEIGYLIFIDNLINNL